MSVKGFKAAAARFVAAVGLVCGLLTLTAPGVQAASWMDPYLDQMVSWGIMRGDINGNLEPERNITRAEFVSMVNRAYGYTEVGPNPYQDVVTTDWFYEDICIARNVGYFSGMSNTVAAPRDPLTREQAAMLIGKNMMLQGGTGETLGFNDSRQFSDWSRHMIEAVAKEGVISGYTDGSFRPQQNVTRGEVAVMLSKAIGTPVQQSGVHSLGGVYGNLTINTPGVTLKDTVVYGDLYVSGGIGLSNVELENVRVLGKIVVSGTGESEKGEHSVLLRNVTADELVLDSMSNQFVTLKSEGFTNIAQVNVRTSAYLEDVTDNGYGLTGLTLDGAFGTKFHLAGNIKDVVNLTPGSTVTLAQGVTQSITIDEKAIGSTLDINNKAMAGVVNLDTATKVEGTGDISHMNVNAAGSSSVMLPDTITVRPGITADIYEEEMDSVAAQESSEDPRLLSGYPAAENVSPKAADLVFKTNKKGTIYWAVTALADGTVEEDELMNPPVYGGTILKSGTLTATGSNTAFTAKVSGLTTDGSYYVSAILVDNRGMRSPVKITAFTTPDDTTPAFASGYPTVTIADGNDGEQIVQALVMPNKNCRMYYALLPKGSTAPKAADFKANAVTGNLGYGIVDVQKNTPYLVSKVNTVHLEEVTDYDLYLWLTDVDGAKSSAVKKVTVKTLDRTAPHIQHLTLKDVKATSVTLDFALNEPGTFYWAVVKHGDESFCRDENGNELLIGSEQMMLKIENGINSLKKGSSNASKASTDVKFTISGLTAQSAYDVYYMAKDKAGNYCIYRDTLTPPKVVHTLDDQPPTVTQEFSHDGSSDPSNLTPYPDSTIRLVFSENIQGVLDVNKDSKEDYTKFLELYQKGNKDELAMHLREYIKLYSKDTMEQVAERTDDKQTDWAIDYRKAKIELDGSGTGELIISFPYSETAADSALNLSGGETYYFVLEGIADTSTAANEMVGVRGLTTLQEFTIISAQILLTDTYIKPSGHLNDGTNTLAAFPFEEFDMTFSARPTSHESMDELVLWDFIFWSNTMISFELYESSDNGANWTLVQYTAAGETHKDADINTDSGIVQGVSIGSALRGSEFQKLVDLTPRLYGIKLTSINDDPDPKNWNIPVTIQVTAVSGNQSSLGEAANSLLSRGTYESVVETNKAVSDITIPMAFSLTHTFMDNTPPNFEDDTPKFAAGDSSVKISVMLDRPNSYFYYVIAPVGEVTTTLADASGTPININSTTWLDENVRNLIPKSGKDTLATVSAPTSGRVRTWSSSEGGSIKSGNGMFRNGLETFTVSGLQPKTDYLVYFVLMGESQASASKRPYVFQFSTSEVTKPTIQLRANNTAVNVITSEDADGLWVLQQTTLLANTPPFSYTFRTYVDTAKLTQFDKLTNAATMTVLEAMVENMGDGQHQSVFDAYAGSTIYEDVRIAVMESAGSDAWLQTGSLITSKDVSQSVKVDPTQLSAGTQYYFVAAVKNQLVSGTTQYAFKAVKPVQASDTIPPYVTNFSQDIDYDDTNLGHGTVALQFSEVVYLLKTDKTTTALSTFKTTELRDQVTSTSATVYRAKCDGGSYLTIEFSGLKVGDTMGLFRDGVISDIAGNSHSSNGKGGHLVLRLNYALTQTGVDADNKPILAPSYFLTIEPASWESK